MPHGEAHALMWRRDGAWHARLAGVEFSAPTRERCVRRLREAAGPGAMLTIEVTPQLAGVAEAATIMGWDKRRVITYLDRGSFPAPIASLAGGRVWRREDVESFAAEWRARRRAR